jgi:putative alpha-1,2-mannosidase
MKRSKELKQITQHIIWMRQTMGSWVITRAHEEAALINLEGQSVASHHRAAAQLCDDQIASCRKFITEAEANWNALMDKQEGET